MKNNKMNNKKISFQKMKRFNNYKNNKKKDKNF